MSGLDVIDKSVVVLFVDECTTPQRKQRVQDAQTTDQKAGHCVVDHHRAEKADIHIHRVEQKDLLLGGRKPVDRVEDRGQIGQQHQKNVIEILHIPEKDI